MSYEDRLDEIQNSPRDEGVVALIVRRPEPDAREVLEEATLDLVEGLVGDNWRTRGSSKTADGSSHPDMQINIMNARVIALIAGDDKAAWAKAGDQFFVDLDLSAENLPTGTRLAVGEALLEVTAMPHNGCKKFMARFGLDALKLVNSAVGKSLRLRGINARVVGAGKVRVGDTIRKV